jgi:hypothetical protein
MSKRDDDERWLLVYEIVVGFAFIVALVWVMASCDDPYNSDVDGPVRAVEHDVSSSAV